MIFDLTKIKLVSSSPVFFKDAFLGIVKILRNDFSMNDAVVFQNGNFFFSYMLNPKIDIVFTDRANKVCKLIRYSTKRKLCFGAFKAVHIVCLKKGIINKVNIENGDLLNLNTELTGKFKKMLEKKISEGFVSSPSVISEK